jgi:hypothetical protein
MPDNAAPTRPLDTAPRVTDTPLLLWERDGDGWQIGYWDGTGWYHEQELRMAPVAWALMPPRPVLP